MLLKYMARVRESWKVEFHLIKFHLIEFHLLDGSVHRIKVHVFHSKEDKPDPGRSGEGHSWIRIL